MPKLTASSEKKVEGLFEAAPDAILVVNREGEIVQANAQAETLFGYGREELLGAVMEMLLPERFRGGHRAHRETFFASREAQPMGAGLELYCLHKDGREFPVEINLTSFETEDGVLVSSVIRDISGRKMAEASLQECERKFRSLFEAANDAIFILDGATFTDCNRQAEVLFRCGKDDIVGHSPLDFSPANQPDGRLSAEKAGEIVQAALNGLPQVFEWAQVRHDGTAFDSEVSLNRGILPKAGYLQASVRDVTERKRAEKALLFKIALLEAVAETTIDGILVVDESDRIVHTNRQFALHFEIPEELLSSGDDRILRAFVIGRVESPDAFTERVEYLYRHRDEKSRDEVKFTNGKTFERYSAPLVDSTGRYRGRIWYFRDITERTRASAERMRLFAAIEQASESVVITDKKGTIEYVNAAFTRTSGFDRSEAIGHTAAILKSGVQDQRFYQELWATILSGAPWHGEIVNRRKDGSLYTVEMSIAPVRDGLGAITHFIATKLDVTQRKLLEDQYRQAQKMEAIGLLAGGVAHDFNNLLTVINGYSEMLLQKDGLVAGQRRRLEAIASAGARAAALTRQLMAFSRRQVFEHSVLDLNRVVSNAAGLLQPMIGEHYQLKCQLEPGLPKIKADATQIEQVIMNLVINARDAMPDGGAIVVETGLVTLDADYAHTHHEVRPGSYAMLAVTDSGTGMDEATRSHIFEPFFTTKEVGRGTGLGLATVFGIVKQSGGTISVYSEPGRGTSMKVYLPAVAEAETAAEGETEADTTSGRETILLVEDEAAVREYVEEVLKGQGYRVLTADGAEAALGLSRNTAGPIHLLVTDIVMPGEAGPDLAERLLLEQPGLRVLFVSGYPSHALENLREMPPGAAFLQKPYTAQALRAKIRAVLDAAPQNEAAHA